MKVLVADDDSWSRDLLGKILHSLGHETTVVCDGQQAWDALQGGGFEVLLTDWKMPQLDGLELVTRVRAAGTRYPYIILITAHTDREHWLSAMDAGADDFLAKPVELELLTVRLRVAERMVGLREEVRKLSQIIPMCSYCRRIRESDDAWLSLEAYVAEHTDAAFSHGACPECIEKHLRPQLDKLREGKRGPK